jgi:hypothetical protein
VKSQIQSSPQLGSETGGGGPARTVVGTGAIRRSLPSRSLILTSIDLGRALAERGATVFRAQGTCMYPCVRPGDVLHVAPRTIGEVETGDIAVCRRPGYLFAHRVIERRAAAGLPCIVTRSDRASEGDDGATYAGDLLGVVTGIERRGRRLSPSLREVRRSAPALLALRLAFVDSTPAMHAFLAGALAAVQRMSVYRVGARLWLAVVRPDLAFEVRLPAGAGDLHHPLSPEEFDVRRTTWRGREVDRWILALRRHGHRRPAALATLVARPALGPGPAWDLDQLEVRARYRCMGFEEALLAKAREILARADATLEVRES